MFNRSNMYDSLPYTINQLNTTIQRKDNTILKGNTDADRWDFFETVGEYSQQETELAKSLANQVETLHQDFNQRKVNYSRVIDFLRPVKTFLTSNPKFNKPGFNREKVEQIVNKYL